jgi:halocyanin-like protein
MATTIGADAGRDSGASAGAGTGSGPGVSRRRVLAVSGAAAAGALAGVPAARAAPTDLSSWFENTDGADEVVDKRGQSTVEITVGADGNDGAFAYAPVAVRVDPGAEVVWTWTGKGSPHNVVASDGAFESDLLSEEGATFAYTPAEAGVHRYYCTPHKAMGMKGALVVGDASVTLSGATPAAANATNGNATGANGSSGGDGTPAAAGESGVLTPAERRRTFDGWLAGTDNYESVVDRTGRDLVTVSVGAEGNGGRLAFDPPAVRVSPGTTVVWEWVVDGTDHDVRAAGGGFASDVAAQVGHRFGVTFTGERAWKYECAAHSADGMRGVVLVGYPERAAATTTGAGGVIGGVGLVGALYGAARLLGRAGAADG